MTSIILSLIKFIKGFSSFLLPDKLFAADLFTNFAEYIDFFTDFIAAANFIIPLHTVFNALGLIVTFKVVKFTIFVVNWLIRSALDVIP